MARLQGKRTGDVQVQVAPSVKRWPGATRKMTSSTLLTFPRLRLQAGEEAFPDGRWLAVRESLYGLAMFHPSHLRSIRCTQAGVDPAPQRAREAAAARILVTRTASFFLTTLAGQLTPHGAIACLSRRSSPCLHWLPVSPMPQR